MNAVSTPIRKKCKSDLSEPFPRITPIKPCDSAVPMQENFGYDNLFDNIVNNSSLFGECKRKSEFLNDDSLFINTTSPDVQQRRKKHKMTNIELFPRFKKKPLGEDLVDNKSPKNITLEMDMFEDDLIKGPVSNSIQNSPKFGDTIEKSEGNSPDVLENSVWSYENGHHDNQLVNLSILEKIEKDISSEQKSEGNQMKDCINEDSRGLNVSLKENAVVDTVLEAMHIQTEIRNSEQEVNIDWNFDHGTFSQILLESVTNWENEEKEKSLKSDDSVSGEINLVNRIKMKLLNNVNNLKIVKSDATGWSQMDASSNISEESIIENSQYLELGPFFGLPSKVQQLYEEHKGITNFYSWQKECLSLKAVKERKNLVYSLPTSGGKTLVAEMLILRELLCYRRNVLFILPFVSIVQEKVHDLSVFALELGFLVEEYAAGKGVIPLKKRKKRKSVIISTIEKASAVIISLIETKQLNEFGLIVVDELHLISEKSRRGSTLESLLAHVLHLGEKIQIIGMTATIGNLSEIAEFLKAETYTGSFRPVELQEFVKCGNEIFSVNWGAEELLQPIRSVKSPLTGPDPDGIGELVMEIVPKDSVLVFCPTKKNCENVALLLVEIMPKKLINYKEKEKISFLRALQTETNGEICPVMRKTIPYGVVYHHSGLTPGERKLLEEAFRTGTLCVICCTSTLAAGVNLPAARVILRSPYIGKDFINLSKYKQMIGRAGRAGMGIKGESYLICQMKDCAKVGSLLKSKMDDAVSEMNIDSMKCLILSSVGLGIASTRAEIRKLLNCTLLSVQEKRLNINVKNMIDSCIVSLFKMGAIKVKDFEITEEESTSKLDISIKRSQSKSLKIMNNSQLTASRLGRAAMKGCIGLERAHELYGDLIKAQASLVLLTELHLLYLVTPYEMLDQIKPNYSVYFNVYMQLSAKELPTAKVVGITEFVISKLATGMKPKNIPESILNRFYIALILNQMLKQQNIWEVGKLFQISAGMIQTLMTSTSTFANNVLRFCEEISELWSFKSLLTEFAPRLTHCCSAELLPLLELPAVKKGRAKQLYEAGFKNLHTVANADVNQMVRMIDHLPKRVAGQIVAAARLLLLEKAENLKEEAEEVLQGLAEKIVSCD